MFNTVLNTVLMFAIYAIIGVIGVKTNVLSEKGLGFLSKLILKITLPIFIFMNTLTGATRDQFIAGLPMLLMGVILFAILFILGFVFSKIFRIKGDRWMRRRIVRDAPVS